jgi:16S rRNA (uracil1498-N3)-methyltransferase
MMGLGQLEFPAVTPATPKIRLFVTDRLAAGARVSLSRGQAHYLSHVMRQRVGDGVLLFNGRDGEWSAMIEALKKNQGNATVSRQMRVQAVENGPWLAFAPIKKAGTDLIVEKATELGASRLTPVFTRNTNATRINRDRLLARAIEAAEQCQRLTVPEIAEPARLREFTDGWPHARRLLVLDETGTGTPIADVLAEFRGDDRGAAAPCGFLSGPEGGFDRSELDDLRKLDFVTTVGLGPRVLRAETATLAALACWQVLLGAGR